MPAPLNIAQASDLVDLSIQKIFMKTSDPEAKFKKYFNFRYKSSLIDSKAQKWVTRANPNGTLRD